MTVNRRCEEDGTLDGIDTDGKVEPVGAGGRGVVIYLYGSIMSSGSTGRAELGRQAWLESRKRQAWARQP